MQLSILGFDDDACQQEQYTKLNVVNVSRYVCLALGCCSCRVYGPGQNARTHPVTHFTKVRFDPRKLVIFNDDYRFAIAKPDTWNIGEKIHNFAPYGVAQDCASPQSVGGQANIDLTGTSLAVVPGQFHVTGWEAKGHTQYSANNQIVDLIGGGFCGFNGPKDTNVIQLEVVRVVYKSLCM